MVQDTAQSLLAFIKKSPTPFHAIHTIRQSLLSAGFAELYEQDTWVLEPRKKYFVIRNQTSIIAFHVGEETKKYAFNMAASHSDAPCYKVKPCPDMDVEKQYVKLNTEGYGGPIAYSWFDRPLSLAGRVIVKDENCFTSKLVCFDKDLLIIPSMSIHQNRTVNDGMKMNNQVDLLPLYGLKGEYTTLHDLLANELQTPKEAICHYDLYVYNRSEGTLVGNEQEFICSPKLDDLQCAYTTLQGFLAGSHKQAVNVYCCFDNEEVGSRTKQGAGSTFLRTTLERIHVGLGNDIADFHQILASSFMVSADNAHAYHPNHGEVADPTNHVFINKGVVIKHHANQNYTTDAVSASLFAHYCNLAEVPFQHFVNRSDVQSGGTLGAISSSQVSVASVDIGLAQFAMHSSFETAGAQDSSYMIQAMTAFFTHRLAVNGVDSFTILS